MGWVIIGCGACIVPILWLVGGQRFLATSNRISADVLIVEGWIGREAFKAAKDEFDRGGYRFLVATGGLTGEPWAEKRWSYAEIAQVEFVRLGVPAGVVVIARSKESDRDRTYHNAAAALNQLRQEKIQPRGIQVFTRGLHTRRSGLVYERVFSEFTPVGVIGWQPENLELTWWNSSHRAKDFLSESVAYFVERFRIMNRNTPESGE